ncbi:hypothetical protein BOTBODRAFT_631067 [Botryobasidium botryosum FD-172 SS1]|uniref:Short-chain dehydrogenase/reductase SDR n=1 Tax=Botryobasidium botryosum (strain FD-172 SS1) TaxID=930990 RepID=A0A067MCK7_BOTB1|nr:hypothetical protein BOTBODRAFT_631067 [Botryobasidium botryosum FD-172 SS1]
MASRKPILVIAGVGNGLGKRTIFGRSREFARLGHSVALIARNGSSLKRAAEEIKNTGADAHAFPVSQYDHSEIQSVFHTIKKHWPDQEIRTAVWNAGHSVWKPFLETTEDEIKESVGTNIVAPFAFARESIQSFKDLECVAITRVVKPNDVGARGTLIFTSATAALRGNVMTSAMAAGKHGLRALAQSLNKEFGKQNIHVAHAIIDGVILTDRTKQMKDEAWQLDPDARLDPQSIAKAYAYLAQQDRSAWTFELDLRPAHEKW